MIGTACTSTDLPTDSGVIATPYGAVKSLVVTSTLGVSNSNTGAGTTSLSLPGTQGYQIRVTGYITRTRIPDGATFQFGPFGQGGCNSSTIKVYDTRGLRAASSMAGDCSYTNYQRYEWVANVNLTSSVTVSRDGGTTTCSPQWSLNPCFVYTGSQTVSIIPLTDTNTPTVSLVADRAQANVGDTVTFTATLGPPRTADGGVELGVGQRQHRDAMGYRIVAVGLLHGYHLQVRTDAVRHHDRHGDPSWSERERIGHRRCRLFVPGGAKRAPLASGLVACAQ